MDFRLQTTIDNNFKIKQYKFVWSNLLLVPVFCFFSSGYCHQILLRYHAYQIMLFTRNVAVLMPISIASQLLLLMFCFCRTWKTWWKEKNRWLNYSKEKFDIALSCIVLISIEWPHKVEMFMRIDFWWIEKINCLQNRSDSCSIAWTLQSSTRQKSIRMTISTIKHNNLAYANQLWSLSSFRLLLFLFAK